MFLLGMAKVSNPALPMIDPNRVSICRSRFEDGPRSRVRSREGL
jgi:hypothetical protein